MSEAPGRKGGTGKRPLNTVILMTVKLKNILGALKTDLKKKKKADFS